MQEAPTAEAACEIAAGVLGENPDDLQFALLYLLGPDGRRAQLAGAAGIAAGTAASPAEIDLTAEERPWLRPQVLEIPIAQPGQERPIGVLVSALSPRLLLDEKYRSFLDLAAGQIATAISRANALAEAGARAEALAEIDRAKTAFFSNVSHELRTPLTLMLGPAQDALGRAATLPPDDVERWQLVHRNGLRLLKLVNTLLDFSRIEAGRVQASYEPTDLSALTRISRAPSAPRSKAPACGSSSRSRISASRSGSITTCGRKSFSISSRTP
jgi:signal transduction histidine kinase